MMLQKLVNLIYRYPKSRFKTYQRFGGYFKYRAMLLSSVQMEKAAAKLPPVQSNDNGLPVYFLTGKKYLYQTLFCIQSLQKTTTEKFQFILVDDGSFDDQLIHQINTGLPGVKLVTKLQIEQNLKEKLPLADYPSLHHKRKVYPHIKKLTDVHTIPGKPWKLVLDSDMLFWAEPKEMLGWLKNPDKPIHMIDCAESYGYSSTLMEQLAGNKIKQLINVGAIGLNSDNIPWSDVDSWVHELETKEGGSYYLEQALSAMIISTTDTLELNKNNYIVNPTTLSTGILLHYVDKSKELYFNFAWKSFVK